MTDIDPRVIESERKRVKYTKYLFLGLLITAFAYIITSSVVYTGTGDPFADLSRTIAGQSNSRVEQPFFTGFLILMALEIVLIIVVQVRYYEDLPYDFDLSKYQTK